MSRDTSHEYRCERCGVKFKGRANKRGEIRASDAPPSGEVRDCVCVTCEKVLGLTHSEPERPTEITREGASAFLRGTRHAEVEA